LLGTLDALHVWIGVDAISLGFACAVSAMVLQKCGQTIAEVRRNADKVLTTVYLNFELFRLFA
jgi:Ethanolamine utilization protein EutJ (predicted chaperonin)